MWKYIVTPIIGAIIGYVTNWIAVKMLFRPRKEVRVFGKRLPFTPGVIPRGQARLAKAVGNVVETQLLTPEYMGEKLLSEESEKEFKSHIQAWVEEQKQSEDTLHSAAVKIVEEDAVPCMEHSGCQCRLAVDEEVSPVDFKLPLWAVQIVVARLEIVEQGVSFVLGRDFDLDDALQRDERELRHCSALEFEVFGEGGRLCCDGSVGLPGQRLDLLFRGCQFFIAELSEFHPAFEGRHALLQREGSAVELHDDGLEFPERLVEGEFLFLFLFFHGRYMLDLFPGD